MEKTLTLKFMRIVALIVLLMGVIGSFCLVLYNGRNNKSILLISLFVLWVLSPFVAFLIADKVSIRWTDTIRKTLYIIILALTLVSLLSYSGLLIPAGTKTAFVFLVVPLISWVVIAIFILIARSKSK
jgi:hypothetical protein